MAVSVSDRSQLVQRGRALEYFTVGYNMLEGLVSIIAGLIAGSVSLVGFGLDSFIEVTSGTALLWRLHHDWNEARREAIERLPRERLRSRRQTVEVAGALSPDVTYYRKPFCCPKPEMTCASRDSTTDERA